MMNLSGIKILVTRPAHQSEHLCQLIANEGGKAIRLPVIEIVEIKPNRALLDCCTHLDDLDIAIFISANAVETAETLKALKLTALCPAPPFNSEAMLEMQLLQTVMVQGKNLVIFRGENGRELLAETLRKRGATVNYVNVYRRTQPPVPAWITDVQVDMITITSVEGLHNLLAMLSIQTWVRHTPFIVMSQRIRAEACKHPFLCPRWLTMKGY